MFGLLFILPPPSRINPYSLLKKFPSKHSGKGSHLLALYLIQKIISKNNTGKTLGGGGGGGCSGSGRGGGGCSGSGSSGGGGGGGLWP